MTISRHLSLVFLAMAAGVSLLSLGAVAWLLGTTTEPGGSHADVHRVERLKSHLNVAVQESLTYVATGVETERHAFDAALAMADGVLDQMTALARLRADEPPSERALLDRVQAARAELGATAALLFEEAALDGASDSPLIQDYDNVMDRVNADLDRLLAIERSRIDETEAAADRAILFAKIVLAGVALVAVLGAFVGGRILGRMITRPILALEQAAHRLAEGDVDRVDESGPREIVVLARAFNRMAADVSSARATLEFAVDERTAALLLANEALRRSEQRYQDLYDNAPDMYFSVDVDSARIVDFNWRTHELLGYSADELRGMSVLDIYDPSCREEVTEARARLKTTGHVSVPHLIVRRKDGETMHVSVNATAVRDANGRAVRSRSIVHDLTLQRKAQERLRESEERYRSLVEHAPLCIHELDRKGRFLSINPSGVLMLGATCRDEVLGRPCLDIVGEADRSRIRDLFGDALRGRACEFEFDFDAEGGPNRFRSCFIPMLDAAGNVVKIMGLTEDVTDRREAERRQRFMIGELDHRVKNNLAAVLSLANQSLANAESLEAFRHSFVGRIHAMARAHEALARTRWRDVDVADAVESALRPFLDEVRPRLTTGGRPARLAPEVASPLGLALHELATNAAKHGALSTQAGRVEVTWQASDERITDLTWIESNGPRVTRPSWEGFGLQLLRGLVEHEIGGALELDFSEAGLTCRIVFPERDPEAPPDAPSGDSVARAPEVVR